MSNRFFVTDPPVAIAEWEPDEIVLDEHGQPRTPNVIYIRARMDVETAGRVQSELLKVAPDGKHLEAHLGANVPALLVHNIVRWEGPDLGGMACTPQNIRMMDPNDPLLEKVLEEITRRNKAREAPRPNSPTATTSNSNGLTAASPPAVHDAWARSGNGIRPSPLQSALTGRLNKPED